MRIPRIYSPQELNLEQALLLEPEAAHHLATVLRIKKGREVIIFNGKGGEFKGIVSQLDRKKVSVTLHEFSEKNMESPLAIHLGICLIKSDRMDWLIQKATELGVSRITPLISEYTDNKMTTDKLEKKVAHWQKIIINACEQSERTQLAAIEAPVKLLDWVSTHSAEKKIILHPGTRKSADVLQSDASLNSITLLIGPEGGFSHEEVAQANHASFESMTLGPRILRAETAPLAAISILQLLYGDFS